MVEEQEIPTVDEVHLVAVTKYGLDETAPLRERFFFRAAFLPFVRFAFKYFHIPAMGARDRDGRFSWVEHIAVVTDKREAEAMCRDEFYAVYPLPLNGELPRESLQYKGHEYPKAKSPGRYMRRVFRLTAARRKDLAMLEDADRRADRLLNAARAG